jgi:hypothetical protein
MQRGTIGLKVEEEGMPLPKECMGKNGKVDGKKGKNA